MLNKVRKRLALIVRTHQHRLRLANGWKTLTAFAHRKGRTWKALIRRMGAELRPAAAEAVAHLRKTGARLVLSFRVLWNRTRREALPLIAVKGRAAFFAAQRWCRTQVQEAKAAAPAVLARAKAFRWQANEAADSFKADIPEMKRHIHRRAMAMTLAVMVTLSMFPAGAFAGEIDGKDSGADSGIPIITPIDDPGTGGATGGGGGTFHEAQWGTDENCSVDGGDLTAAVAYANSLSSGTAYIRLNTDSTLFGSLVFNSGKTTVLDLNGKTIDAQQGNFSVLTVNGTLTLTDTSTTDVAKQGKITGGSNNTGGGVTVSGGDFTMKGGRITNNFGLMCGGVLMNTTASFTMTGGEISGNTGPQTNGCSGVMMNGTMTVGGTAVITGNKPDGETTESNLMLMSGKTVTVSTTVPLASGASIGVTTLAMPAAGTPVNITGKNENDVSKYFTSDNNSYDIQNGASNTVQLAAVPSCEARWGVAKADGSAPDNWAGTGTLNNAATYSYSITEGTAYIQLQSDVQTTAVLSFVINPTILDLNGKTINNKHSAFVLRVQNTLTLKDTSQDGGGKIIGGQSGVMIDGGNFTMTGGEISGNTGYGGVCVSSGDFTMAGGSITGNTASYGGGVSVSSGNFTMTGGSITGNTAPYGGGVGISGGNFIMTGGEISGNEADTLGGGVYVYSGSLTVGGTAKITGNKKGTGNDAADSNVYLYTGVTISVSGSKPLASGASIGVNTEIAPTAGTPVNITGTSSNDISSYFNSDDNYCSIQNSATGNTVQLVAAPATEARWGLAGTGGTVPATWTNGTLADAMTYANGLSGGTAYIQLGKDVQTTATLRFASEKTTILDLNGKTIDGKNNTEGPVVYVEGNLTLTDTGSGGAGKITGGTAGIYASGNGGGVYVGTAYGSSTPGSFTMKGGVITGNDTSAKGDSSAGSGVFVAQGSFLMEGGSITGNTANSGGGMLVGTGGSFVMTGGSITGNTALYKWGGGVDVSDGGTMTVGGTANISGNHTGTGADAAVNNVFLEQDSNSNQITISVSTSTPLVSGASIGVTTGAAPTASVPVSVTGANANDVSGYFHSDDSKYSIQNSATGNTVQLANGAVPITEARWGLAGTGGTVPATWTNGTLADAMTYANGLSSGTAYIQLGKDVQTTATLNFASGKTTILDLNGKTVDANHGAFSVLTVNGTLTLKDTSGTDATKQGKITGGAPKNTVDLPYSGGGVSVNATGSFTMDGGSITGNTTAPGAGVYVNTGSFTMNGGSITGNDSGGFGGGVCVEHGSFTMNDGSITQNTAATGGGVAVTSGSFTMNDGSITGNTTNTEHVKGLGGGVALYTAVCVMNGGEISGNSAGTLGGGVQVYSDSTITVSGTVKISGNTAFDSKIADNVYLYPKATISVSSSKPLVSGSSIGVKAGTVPTAGTPVNITGTNNSDVSKYFLSDDSAYSIRNSAGNVVQLAYGAAPGGTVWDGTSAQYFAGGTGTEADPYQIATAEQLCLLSGVINQYDYSDKSNPVSHITASRKVVAAQDAQTYDYLQKAYYKLTADIALNGTTNWESWNTAAPTNSWKPIGAYYYTFKGHFDGSGKTVSGMYYSDISDANWTGASGGNTVGLFGFTAGATVENVTVAQSYVRGSGYVGGVVGCNDPSISTGVLTVTNCHNRGTVSGSYAVGGVVGFSRHALGGAISNCTNSGAVSGTNRVGGIVGDSQIVTNCQNSGTVSGETNVGGVVAQSQGNVTNCRNTGAVSGTGSNIGGVVGGQCSPSVVSNCASPKGLVTDATGDIGEWQTPPDTHQYIGHIIGNGIGGNGNSSGSISNGVSISPADVTVAPGGTQVFTAKVGDGTGTQTVTWSLANGDGNVSIDETGKVTIGSGVRNGKIYVVKAVSAADSTKVATAGVTVDKTEPGTVWDGTSAQYFAGGTGTETDPYQIATAEQLCLLSAVINQYDYRDKSNPVSNITGSRKVVAAQDAQTYDYLQTAYYKLTADIALNDTTGWESWNAAAPANSWKPIGGFKGHFDGSGKTVSGMYFSDLSDMTWNGASGGNDVGLFGSTAGATVENVTVAQSYVRGNFTVGGVVGGNDPSISTGVLTLTNCHNSGTVIGVTIVGGVVGLSMHALGGVLSNCTNSGAVSGTIFVGGIAGDSQTVTNCQNSGTVSGVNIVGGVMGQSKGNVTNCRNTGAVSGTGSDIGGVIGGLYATPAVVSGCVSPKGLVADATGDIGEGGTPSDTHQYIGHIIGHGSGGAGNSSGSISNGVSISPANATVAPGGTQVFTAKVGDGTGTQTVTWSLANGDGTVSIDGTGKITVGSGATNGRIYIVKAVSAADSTQFATASVTVGKASSEPGTVWNGTSAQYFAGGTGTQADPYQIATAEQLCLLSAVINQYDYSDKSKPVSFGAGTRKVVEGQDAQTYDYLQKAYYKLTADIVLNDTANWESWDTAAPANSWKPIGIYATQKDAQKLFKGTFDGGDKTICGLYYHGVDSESWNGISGTGFIGLFSYVTGEIKNVTLSNSYIMYGNYIGGIAGVNDGTITNCKTSGIVTGYLSVGGIAGENNGTITGCQNSGTVQTGLQGAGGIAGGNWGTIADCQNSGTIRTYQSSSSNILGGIAGGNYFHVVFTATGEAVINSGVVRSCQNTGSISSTNSIGGIVGYNCATCTVTDCSSAAGLVKNATGDIGAADKPDPNAGHFYLGNIIGKNENTSINGAAPTITTASLPGGTMGTAYSQTIAATGSAPMTWSVASGSLPGGLSLNASTGAISGTPTAAGTFNFTVKAQNSKGSASKALSITVTSPISSVSVTPSTATVKKTKTQQFSATVTGTASDKSVTWSVNSTKSSIDQNGLLTVGATETAATLTVKATSKVDGSKSGTATVTVTAAPKICTVTFDSDGGSAVSPIGGIEEGKTTALPDAPTRDSCRFDGWFTAKNGGGTPFTALTTVTDNITVYAKWTRLVTVAGTVVNYDNTPIPNASVTLNPTYGTSAVTTDAQGSFSFANIPEDLFTVTAKFSDDSIVTVNVTGDYGNVKIVRPRPSIAITTQPQDAMIVKGITGQSAVFTVAGTRTPYLKDSIAYQWYWLKGTTPNPLSDTKMDGSGSQMTFNEANGNIPSDPGTYRLYGYAYDSTANIEAFSRIATLKVVGTNTVAGVVKKADGTLISGAKVELKYADGAWPYGSVAMTSSTNPQTTGSDGAYRFETVPDGRYTLVITLPNGGKIISGPYSFPGTNPPAHPTDPIDPGIVIPDAASIRINGQPQDATVKNGTSVSLTADASSTDGTVLTYQWYSSGKNSNSGGAAIPDATGASYAPSTTNKGTTYYYCVVSGGTLAPVTTRAAKVTVFTYGVIQGTVQTKEKQPINGATVELINIDTPAQTGFTSSQNPQTTAADGKYKFADVPDGTYRLKITLPGSNAPIFVVNPINVPNVIPDLPVTPPDKAAISITSQPKNQTVVLNDTAKFTVGAGVSTGGTVLYQWYSNTTNSTSGGTAIDGATSATYSAPTDTKGVVYYYCVVQATGADAVTSSIAKLTVRKTPLNNLMTIQGVVKDESGSPVENASVALSPKAGSSANPQTTGTDGHYKFENLPDGQYTVTVKLPNGGVVNQIIVINDGDITPTAPNNITVPTDNDITITQQPTVSTEVTTDMTAGFTVNATATKAGVTYQWYRNAANTNSGGEKLDGATNATLTLDKQPEGVCYYYCVVSSAGAADKATNTAKLTITKAPDNKGNLGGGIVSDDNGNPVKGATVKLMKNGTDGIQFGATVTTGDDGKFQFSSIPYGSYSLVAQKELSTVTRQITIRDAITTENLILPSGAKITKVVIGDGTPSAAAGNLEAMFDDTDNAIAQQPGAQVEIRLVVKKQDNPSDKDAIDAALGENQQVGVYLNATLVKIISGTSDDGSEEIQPTAGQTLHIVLDIPKELQGKPAYHIFRSHVENGVTDVSAISAEYDSTLQTLSFDADAFSTYAVAYTQVPKYSVTVMGSQSTNSGTGLYEAGDTVTVQAGTRSGYSFTGWTSGDGVTFANTGSASTTFTMPAKNVTVTANWKYNGGGSGGNGGNGGGNGGTNPGDNDNPGGNPNPNPNPNPNSNPNPAPNPNGGNTKPGGNNNHGGTGSHGGTTNHGGSTNNQGGGSGNGSNTNAGSSNNGTGGKTTPENNNSSSGTSDSSALNAAKDSALQKLADARQKAVDALPKSLTDEQRKKALDEIDRIYSVAIKNIQNADSADAISGITDQTSHDFADVAAGAGGAKPAQAPAGAAAPKPFILLSAGLAAAAVLGAALAWRRREEEETSGNPRRIIATAAAAAAVLLFLLTTGWQGVALANLWTIALAVLAAGSLICALRRK